MASQTHSPLTEFSERGSCHDCPSHPHRRRHRTEGFLTNYSGTRIRALLDNILVNTFNLIWFKSGEHISLYLQYIHNDTNSPAVHRSAVSLPANNFRCWKQRACFFFLSVFFLLRPQKQLQQYRIIFVSISGYLPRYSGVPQGSLMNPFSSFANWKSLITILECFKRLKYTRFSSCMSKYKSFYWTGGNDGASAWGKMPLFCTWCEHSDVP